MKIIMMLLVVMVLFEATLINELTKREAEHKEDIQRCHADVVRFFGVTSKCSFWDATHEEFVCNDKLEEYLR